MRQVRTAFVILVYMACIVLLLAQAMIIERYTPKNFSEVLPSFGWVATVAILGGVLTGSRSWARWLSFAVSCLIVLFTYLALVEVSRLNVTVDPAARGLYWFCLLLTMVVFGCVAFLTESHKLFKEISR